MRRRHLISIIFTVGLSFFSTPALALDAPAGQVVLTVTGDIAETNRGAYDAKADLFIKHHERTFKKAAAFDLSMLEALGMRKFRIGIPGDTQPRWVEGVPLRALLRAVGAKAGTVSFLALDGFAVEISAEELMARDWRIVLKTDGKYLGLGQRGPLWIVFPPKGKSGIATSEEEGRWPWATFMMTVGPPKNLSK